MQILIADDGKVSRMVIEKALEQWGYDFVSAKDGDEAWSCLQAPGAPRLAILDWEMPGLNGVEVCKKLRERDSGAYVYVILLTSKEDKGSLVEGLESGADDFVSKPFHPDELRARIRNGFRILDLEQNLVRVQERLAYQASHDALTGILNRGAILGRLAVETARSERDGKSLSVLMIDADHFKPINDTRGHAAGDAVLEELGRRLSARVDKIGDVGRYGGEEFLVVLPGFDRLSARSVAESLRRAVESIPFELGSGPLKVTVSIGLSVVHGSVGARAVEDLVRQADVALYQAKHAGRNCVVVHQEAV